MENYKGDIELKQFLYDGSFEGFLTAIFYGYSCKESCVIVKSKEYIPNLIDEAIEVYTEEDKFNRVYNSISNKLNDYVLKNIYYLYLSDISGAENIALDYLKLCYKYGTNINLAKNNETIILVDKYYRRVGLEGHRFTGFVRFKEIAPLSYYAAIEPDHNILPIIFKHFTTRFSDQNFIIHDIKREIAIVYNKKEAIITDLTKDEGEELNSVINDNGFDELWKTFYNSVNIEERKNHRCRNQHMPKRYWKHLTEI